MTFDRIIRFARPQFTVVAAALLLTACQPSPEKSLERAEAAYARGDYAAAIVDLKNAVRAEPNFTAARLLLARSAYMSADFGTAESEYVRVLEQGFDQPEAWIGLGRVLYETGRVAEAAERIAPNIEGLTDNAAAQALAGEIYLGLGNEGLAVSHFNAALDAEPGNPRALVGLAMAAALGGDEADAERQLVAATREQPESTALHFALGNLYHRQARLTEAAEAFERAVATETIETPVAQRFISRGSLANARLDNGELDEAAEAIEGMRQQIPNHPLVRYFRGRLAFHRENYEVAQQELQDYLAMVPDDLRGQAILGAVKFSQNYLQQAEMYLQRAVRSEVGGEMSRRLLAETQLRLNKPGEALDSLGALNEGEEDNPVLLSMLGRAQLGLGNNDAAIQYLEQGLAADSTNPAMHLSLAAGLLSAGRVDEAIARLEQMPEESGELFRRETLLIAAHMRNEDEQAAIQASDQLIRDNPDAAQAYATAGILHRSLGDNTTARNYFEDAVERDPENLTAIYGIGQVAEESAADQTAIEWYSRALDVAPAHIPSLAGVARLMVPVGRADEVRRRLDAALEDAPGSAVIRELKARVWIATDNAAEALAEIEEARREHPDDPRLDHLEGMARLADGQTESAVGFFSRAAAAASDNAQFQLDHARVRLSTDDYAAAARAAGAFRALRPDDEVGLAIQVEALAKANRVPQARTALDEFRAANGGDQVLDVLAGDVEMYANNAQAAVEYYESAARREWSSLLAPRLANAYLSTNSVTAANRLREWVDLHPDDRELRRLLAQILQSGGEAESAVAEYEKLLASGDADAVTLNNLAWQYQASGQEGALELAERARALRPDNGSINDTLGWILYQRGDLGRSAEVLRTAAELSPNNPDIQYHLATVVAASGGATEARNILDRLLASERNFTSRPDAEALKKSLDERN